jgi:hypothetical protein
MKVFNRMERRKKRRELACFFYLDHDVGPLSGGSKLSSMGLLLLGGNWVVQGLVQGKGTNGTNSQGEREKSPELAGRSSTGTSRHLTSNN